jgi:hypothetical protein
MSRCARSLWRRVAPDVDSVETHPRKARLDSSVGAGEALFGEKPLAFHRRHEIVKKSGRAGVRRFFGYADRMDAVDDWIGFRGPIHGRAFRSRKFDPVRSDDRDGKLPGYEEIRRVGVSLLRLRILIGQRVHVFTACLVSQIGDHPAVPLIGFGRQADFLSFPLGL